MPEKTTKELLDEYYKEHPEKRPLGRRLADNRKAAAEEKAKFAAIYREEFNKQRAVSLKARAKQEAREKYRPTRRQKIDNLVDSIGSLGGAPTQQRRKTPKKHKKKKKRKTSNDPFNLDGFGDIGDFNF